MGISSIVSLWKWIKHSEFLVVRRLGRSWSSCFVLPWSRSVREIVVEMGVLPDGADLDALLDVRGMTEPGIPGA